MPEEDDNFNILKEIITKRDLKEREYFSFGDWFLDGINYSGDEYIKKRSKNTRSGVGKKARRMEKLGHLEFRVGTEREKLDEYLALYQEVRGKSWKHPERDIAFLNDARRMAAEKQCLKFGFLFLNSSPIATLFAIISKNTAYLMEVVYDSEFDRFSPGEIIHGEFIKYLIDVDRITEVDALRGDEPYKKSWTPQRRERRGILVFKKNFKGLFLTFLMTKMLPIVEKNKYILSAKNKLSGYLKKTDPKMLDKNEKEQLLNE
jgi:CelD/BcsL family acetyltransferase involved in cellulose biosynthesis